MAVSQQVRVRFAPSPTGNLHIGGMRTAFFNLLYARHTGGTFLIRIEDTDLERSKEEYVTSLLDSLSWVGIKSDEPLVFQSQRAAEYQAVLHKLLAEEKIYRCICTEEQINNRHEAAGKTGSFIGYDGYCRKNKVDAKTQVPFVLRFAIPENATDIVIEDLIRQTVVFKADQFDDFIIVRSDGGVTYNFAVVVDDYAMKISHVIRGEEHLGNTPKQIFLYNACGYPAPQFAHIPLILNPEGGKLSKRDAAVDVLSYKKEGYLPHALLNYMVRLGWGHKDQELFTLDELIEFFTLEGVGRKSGIFDTNKLQWVNGEYIKKLSAADCYAWIKNDIMPSIDQDFREWSSEKLLVALQLYKDRSKTGKQLYDHCLSVYHAPESYNQEDMKNWVIESTVDLLTDFIENCDGLEDFTTESVRTLVMSLCERFSLKLVAVAQPLRIALTGSASSPGVFDLLALLGRQESVKRIKALCSVL